MSDLKSPLIFRIVPYGSDLVSISRSIKRFSSIKKDWVEGGLGGWVKLEDPGYITLKEARNWFKKMKSSEGLRSGVSLDRTPTDRLLFPEPKKNKFRILSRCHWKETELQNA